MSDRNLGMKTRNGFPWETVLELTGMESEKRNVLVQRKIIPRSRLFVANSFGVSAVNIFADSMLSRNLLTGSHVLQQHQKIQDSISHLEKPKQEAIKCTSWSILSKNGVWIP